MKKLAAALLPLFLLVSLAAHAQTGVVSGASVTATGATAARSLADRFATRVNVRDFGAKCDNATDDRAAFAAAINRENSLLNLGVPSVIYVPAGSCLIKGTGGPLPIFSGPGGVVGDGPHMSFVVMDSSYSGDLFSWSEAWVDGTWPGNAVTLDPSALKIGPLVEGLTIIGNRTSASAQYAMHFYDRNDYIMTRDVSMFFINGPCMSFGDLKNTTQAFQRESSHTNIKCFQSGTSSLPAIDLHSTAFGGTPVDFNDVEVFGPEGVGVAIRTDSASNTLRDYNFNRLRIEGLAGDPAGSGGDLLKVGDASLAGQVTNIKFSQLELLSPYSGFCAMSLNASAQSVAPTNISVSQGFIGQGGSAGKGLCLNAGHDNKLQFLNISTVGTDVTVGATPLVGANNTIDGNGTEGTWTWSVDSSAKRLINGIVYKFGDPVDGSIALSATYHDGTTAGGNTLGQNAVDWQSARTSAAQAATGTFSVLAGGQLNVVGGNTAAVGGGFNNAVNGQYSATPGGRQGSDRNRYGLLYWSSGEFGTQGDAEATVAVLRGSGSGTSAFRLTADTTAANSANCMDIPDRTAFTLRISLHARDSATSGTDYSWTLPNAIISRDSGIPSTALSLGTPAILTRGTTTGASVSATADTTNGCLNLSFTPPSGNADTWHAVARIDAVEVQ